MIRISVLRRSLLLVACMLPLATSAWAQLAPASIAGAARDSSGAVLPGVTVEAASPALIEKVRVAVTDGEGRYNIVDLRPGTYTVTFTLPGFSVFRREGVVLSSGFTATVNGELQIGTLEETITVSGAAPLVDTQNVRQQTVMTAEMLQELPTGQASVVGLAALTPGMVAPPDVGGTQGTFYGQSGNDVTYHGKPGNTRVQYDGMRIQNMSAGGSPGYAFNSETVEEMSVQTGGMSAESASTGVVMNLVPKEGGNDFRTSIMGRFTNGSLQSDNIDDELRGRGLSSSQQIEKLYDYGVSVGGPIKRDRVWFFTSIRRWGNTNRIPGVFWNATQGSLVYTPDESRPATVNEYNTSNAVRITWQATTRNKLNIFVDANRNCVCRRQSASAPETQTMWNNFPEGIFQATWTLPLTNRVLIEAGAAAVLHSWHNHLQKGISVDDISILEQSTNFRYNNATTFGGPRKGYRYPRRFSVAYVTGSHAFKVGMTDEPALKDEVTVPTGNGVSYTFLNGVPVQLTQQAHPLATELKISDDRLGVVGDGPFRTIVKAKADLGIYVQDQWTIDRVTLNYGLRFDYYNAYTPAISLPASPFVPARDLPALHQMPSWKDWSPRLGASYDVFGTGRTALKVSMGRYLEMSSGNFSAAITPVSTSVTSANRPWTDANGNFVPDCDLANFAANGECGRINNLNFGQNNPRATQYADDVLRGYGARLALWDFGTELHHELRPGISVAAGYYRNWDSNFRVTQNVAVAPEDFDPFCVTAPADPRLPGGGGYEVCGLYDVKPAKFGQVDNLVTQASNFGEQSRVGDFFSLSLNARFGAGIRVGGGVDTGRNVADNCVVVDTPQRLLHCRVVTPFAANTQMKLNGSVPLPAGFTVSATFQSVAGPEYQANYSVTSAAVAPSLGRPLAGGARTATVPLVAPDTLFEDRRNQLDLRLSKIIRIARTQLQANIDFYNALNSNAILALNSTYGAQWLQPSRILDPRMIQLSGTLSF